MRTKALILFTRVPRNGATKTRMLPHLEPQECADLHRSFLSDIASACASVDADLFVAYTDEPGFDEVDRLRTCFSSPVAFLRQRGACLGERMAAAFDDVFDAGYGKAVLLGCDIPEIHAGHIESAFEKLDGADAVLGPTGDGGYHLIGLWRPQPQLFALESYGHGLVLEQTLAQARAQGLKVACTEPIADIDTVGDLVNLRERLQHDRASAPSTARFLDRLFASKKLEAASASLSIVVPLFNEEAALPGLLEQLARVEGRCEVVFVDGGSTDRTLSLLPDDAKVVHSAKGRGTQMNAGAQRSTGDVLLFLHCDSILPPRFIEEIGEVMREHQVGCFGVDFASRNIALVLCQAISHHRCKRRHILFGDQGIFIARDLFLEIGGFPELPIMEDYQLSLTLKEKGIVPGCTAHKIVTSTRRFPQSTVGKLRTMFSMAYLRALYRKGHPIDDIAARYADIR